MSGPVSLSVDLKFASKESGLWMGRRMVAIAVVFGSKSDRDRA